MGIMKHLKWAAAGMLAIAVVPAVGLARHASYVSAATPMSLSALATAEPVGLVHKSGTTAKHHHKSRSHKHTRHAAKGKSRKHKMTKKHH